VTLPDDDLAAMREALAEARLAPAHEDVPIGAVVVESATGRVVARAHNRREVDGDPTAHAEMLVLRAAAREAGSWHLEPYTLVVTLEPCAMCAGAAVNARLGRLVFGASDPKGGFGGSLGNLLADPRLNHRLPVEGGVLGEECGELLREFFRARR
jgi:tRNA(adenine34) deaminase